MFLPKKHDENVFENKYYLILALIFNIILYNKKTFGTQTFPRVLYSLLDSADLLVPLSHSLTSFCVHVKTLVCSHQGFHFLLHLKGYYMALIFWAYNSNKYNIYVFIIIVLILNMNSWEVNKT